MGILLAALTLSLGLGLGLGLPQNKRETGVDIIVDLGYSQYRGKTFSDGTSSWFGMRYAAAPVGQLRFAPPQDPARTSTIQAADSVSMELVQSDRLSKLIRCEAWSSMSFNAFGSRREAHLARRE